MIKLNEINNQDYCKKLFGKELFGHTEVNTGPEEAMKNLINDYLKGQYSYNDKNKLKNKLKILFKCKNSFPKDLIPETNLLFRGTTINEENFDKIMNTGKITNLRGKKTHKSIKPVKYIPKSEIQGWTTDLNTATALSVSNWQYNSRFSKRVFPAILKYNFPDNEIIFNSDLIVNKLKPFNEHEVLRIGKEIYVELYIIDETLKLIEKIKKLKYD